MEYCEAKGGGPRWSLACDVDSRGVSPFGEAFLTVKSNAHTRGSYRYLPAQETPPQKKVAFTILNHDYTWQHKVFKSKIHFEGMPFEAIPSNLNERGQKN